MPARRRFWTWAKRIGLLLVLAGVGFQAYIAWEYWGTTWVARGRQERLVEQLERKWEELPPQPVTTSAPLTPKPVVVEPPRIAVAGTTADAILRIPAFGPSYAVPIVEGTSPDALAVGAGRFTRSAHVGEVGNYAIAAHRVTHGEPFRNLPDLRAGDRVVIDTAKWRYTYVLDTDGNALRVGLTDTWVVDPLPRNPRRGGVQPHQAPGQRLITLATCAELFHTDHRLVAFGHLVDRSPRS